MQVGKMPEVWSWVVSDGQTDVGRAQSKEDIQDPYPEGNGQL